MRSQPPAELTLLKVLVAIFSLHKWSHLGNAKPCPRSSTYRSTWLSPSPPHVIISRWQEDRITVSKCISSCLEEECRLLKINDRVLTPDYDEVKWWASLNQAASSTWEGVEDEGEKWVWEKQRPFRSPCYGIQLFPFSCCVYDSVEKGETDTFLKYFCILWSNDC